VLDKLFFGPAPHEHTDPKQRLVGVAALPPDSKVIAQLLAADPAPEVRTAAATRCSDPAALAAALTTEADPQVRAAVADSLGKLLAATADDGIVRTVLSAPECVDAVRARVALHSKDDERRRIAINGIGDEDMLVDVALGAEHASVRLAAAERVHAPEALRRLYKGVRDKDRGVARLARERLDAISQRAENAQAADVLLTEAEALVAQPGPILTAAVELDRRWKALVLGDDVERRARWEDIGRRMQQRFDRELQEQRVHMQFEQRLNHWLAALRPPAETAELPVLRNELNALRGEAVASNDASALARLERAEQQIAEWERIAPVLAAAEALVVEAEQLATGTPIDDAQLPPLARARSRGAYAGTDAALRGRVADHRAASSRGGPRDTAGTGGGPAAAARAAARGRAGARVRSVA